MSPFDDSTGWRAEAFRNFQRDMGLGLHVWRRFNGALQYVQSSPLVVTTLTEEEAAVWREPSLSLPDGMAVAVLDALSAWHGGTSEVRTLRRDYDAERARVDKLTAAVIDIAKGATGA